MSDSDGGWSDSEEEGLEAPQILGTYRVARDFIPTTNDHLTLLQDNLVYVFKKSSDIPGFWEGEHKGIYGKFPKEYVVEVVENEVSGKKKDAVQRGAAMGRGGPMRGAGPPMGCGGPMRGRGGPMRGAGPPMGCGGPMRGRGGPMRGAGPPMGCGGPMRGRGGPMRGAGPPMGRGGPMRGRGGPSGRGV